VTKLTPVDVNRTQDPDGADLYPGTVASGEFFVVDRRAFAATCKLGLNPTVAYLTIARGARSRRTSLWSVDAIERRTGMSRPKAKVAIKSLIENSLLTLERPGMKPSYGIVSAHELPEMRLSADDHIVLKFFGELSETRIAQRYVGAAADLARRGFLTNNGNRWFSKMQFDLLPEEPQHIWLPNAVVDGAAGETPPLALLRQMQDVRCLRLFVRFGASPKLVSDFRWVTLPFTNLFSQASVGRTVEILALPTFGRRWTS
jgi:hypothetical protein